MEINYIYINHFWKLFSDSKQISITSLCGLTYVHRHIPSGIWHYVTNNCCLYGIFRSKSNDISSKYYFFATLVFKLKFKFFFTFSNVTLAYNLLNDKKQYIKWITFSFSSYRISRWDAINRIHSPLISI